MKSAARKSDPLVQPSLFEQPAPTLAPPPPRRLTGMERAERGKVRAASTHAAIVARLVPIAQQLARAAFPDPITIDDVIREAWLRKIDLGDCPDYLGAVMKRARLQATGQRVRSSLEQKHGNWRMCWRWVEER